MKLAVATSIAAAVLAVVGLTFVVGASGAVQQFAPATIGVVDLQDVADRSEIGKQTQTRVREFFQSKQAEFTERESMLQTEAAGLENQKAVMSAEAYAQRKNVLEQQMLALSQDRDQAEAELNQLRQDELDKFASAVGPVIETVGKELGLTVVLDRRNGVYYFDPVCDITDLIVDRINQPSGGN